MKRLLFLMLTVTAVMLSCNPPIKPSNNVCPIIKVDSKGKMSRSKGLVVDTSIYSSRSLSPSDADMANMYLLKNLQYVDSNQKYTELYYATGNNKYIRKQNRYADSCRKYNDLTKKYLN